MKKQFVTAEWIKLFFVIGAIASLSVTDAAPKPPSDQGDRVVTGGDLAFMNDAAPGGRAEIELGRLATERASTSAVREFAQEMIKDHTKAGEQLEALAEQKKVKLPPGILPQAMQTKEKLTALRGEDFDREYVKAMVQVHEKDVVTFEAVAKNATDADVKAFAALTAPTLRHHLEMIRTIAERMNLQAK
ncbi:MAG: DUF4142 domain-containing protein [Chthoniobacterales bacterium]|nr:DUF4142 domain-containing protein [Chthoniobacterales bacterium]